MNKFKLPKMGVIGDISLPDYLRLQASSINLFFKIFIVIQKNKVPRNKPNQGGKRPVLRKLHNTEERN